MNGLCCIMSLLLTLLSKFRYSNADCTVNNTVIWIPIAESDYDRSLSPITDASARPLGFSNAVYVYQNPSVCVVVNNVTTSRVQTLVSTTPPSNLCVRNNPQQPLCTAADGTFTECDTVRTRSDGSALFEFYCDSSCAEADVRFWYRFTVSPDKSGDNEEWCRDQSANFPSSLITVPPNLLMTTTTPGEPNTALSRSVSVITWSLITAILCLTN